MNPISCGALELILGGLGEKYALSVVNQTPAVYTINYLYKILKTKVNLPEKAVMHDIEHTKQYHGQEVFGSLDFSQPISNINEVMRIQVGGSITTLASNFSAAATKVISSKIWDITISRTISLLRDFVHRRPTFLELLHRFDKLIVENLMSESKRKHEEAMLNKNKKSKGKSRQPLQDDTSAGTSRVLKKEISLLEINIVAFLTELRKLIEEALERMSFEYMTLHCACISLFKAMSDVMGPFPGKSSPPADWRQRTIYPMFMVNSIFD